MDRGWTRVAERVFARRTQLGHRTMSAFAKASGLSMTTIDALEHARQTSYHASTLATVEHSLGWQPGSIDRILHGREPKPVSDPELAALLDLWPRLTARARRMVVTVATEAARAE